MNAAFAQPTARSRGADLLLAHCDVLEPAVPHVPASERLREALGADLATMLVGALVGPRGRRFRDVA